MSWSSSMAGTSNAPFHGQAGLRHCASRVTWAWNLRVVVHMKILSHARIALRSGDAWRFAQGDTTCTTAFWSFFGNLALFEHFAWKGISPCWAFCLDGHSVLMGISLRWTFHLVGHLALMDILPRWTFHLVRYFA